jgi:hypothetical protein
VGIIEPGLAENEDHALPYEDTQDWEDQLVSNKKNKGEEESNTSHGECIPQVSRPRRERKDTKHLMPPTTRRRANER